MRPRSALPVCLLVATACAGTRSASSPDRAAPTTATAAAPTTLPSSAAPSEPVVMPSAAPSASAAVEAPAPARLRVTFHREIDAPSTALALEVPPHAAALAHDAAWIHDRVGWRREGFPAAILKGSAPKLGVFYGRDTRIRVVGTQERDGAVASVYLRARPHLILANGEIGRFADLKGGLVAVLGDADPEILCRLGDQCVIKRRTGWTFVPIPPALDRVALGGDVGWAVGGQQAHKLAATKLDSTFHTFGPTGSWKHVDGLFALPDRPFVIETEPALVHVLESGRWRVFSSPVPRPRAMWGTAPDDLWIVGDGLAHFDGVVWRVADDAPGPFEAVLGRNRGDVWLAGANGVFRVEIAR